MDRRTVAGNLFCVSLAGGVAALIGATALPPGSPYFRILVFLGAAGLILGLLGLVALYFSAPKAVVIPTDGKPQVSIRLGTKAREKPQEAPLLPDNITAELLIDMCRDKTDIQAEGEVSLYIGKRLRVTGQLLAASRMMNQTSVSIYLAAEGSSPTAYLLFERDQDRVAVLRKGDVLSAVGTIFAIDSSEIRLRNCRLTN